MPRVARKISKTGFYHIIIRGVNKDTIFKDDSDRNKFLHLLKYYKIQLNCKVYAYCLMSNHVHLLIEDKKSNIGELMKNITCVYAGEFNKKYNRVGHLFQDRYKSQNVENQNYLLRLIRYIHRNPEKAGICKTENYKWSSYNEVIYGAKIIDRDFILSIYNDNKFYAINEFKKQMTENHDDILDSAYIKEKLSDAEASRFLEHLIKTKQIPEITTINLTEIVDKIKEIKPISKDQLIRVMGIKRSTFYKIRNKK